MVDFKPRLKSPGDILSSADWNAIQNDILNDITTLERAFTELKEKKPIFIASGLSSHGCYVPLNWDVMPHVFVSFAGYISDDVENEPLSVYPYDITKNGFYIYAKSVNGIEGIVYWIAVGSR